MHQHYDATEREILADRNRYNGTYGVAYHNGDGGRATVRSPRAGHPECGTWYAVLVDGREIGRFGEWHGVYACLTAVLGPEFERAR